MRKWIFILAAIALSPLASADQTDARLDSLFTELQQSTNINTIRATENQIWQIWLQHDDADVVRLMELGTQRMNTQRYNDALLIFSQITEHFPDYAEAWNKRATLYYLVDNLDASLADIEKTLTLEPRHFGALSGQGLVYIQRNELSKAKQSFENLVRVHPNSPNAKENLEMVTETLRFQII